MSKASICRASPHPPPWAGLAHFESDLINATHAFHRWIVRSSAAARVKDLSATDALVLHQIAAASGRNDGKGVADLSFMLNIEDVHVVSYSIRKLVALGIVEAVRHGKEVSYSTTRLGEEYLALYRQVREECLLQAVSLLEINPAALKELARHLRKLSGRYDQAARAASSF